MYKMLYMSESIHPPGIKLAGTVTVGPKGQVVIPADIREKMEIAPGDKMVALYVTKHKAIAFVPESQVQSVIDKMGSKIEVLKNVLNNK
jgi:AbrB family looped-hinge helix DNA binding protein